MQCIQVQSFRFIKSYQALSERGEKNQLKEINGQKSHIEGGQRK